MTLNLVHQLYTIALFQMSGMAFAGLAVYRLASTYNVHLMKFWIPESRPGFDTLFEHYPSLFVEVPCYAAIGIILFLSGRRRFKTILQREEMAVLQSKMDSIKRMNQRTGTLILAREELEEPQDPAVGSDQTVNNRMMDGRIGTGRQVVVQKGRNKGRDTGTTLLTKEELGERSKTVPNRTGKNAAKIRSGNKNLKTPRSATGGAKTKD